jgi:hypothetical protein
MISLLISIAILKDWTLKKENKIESAYNVKKETEYFVLL